MGEDRAEDAEVPRGQTGAPDDGGLVELDDLGGTPPVQPHPQTRAALLLADLTRHDTAGARRNGDGRGRLRGRPRRGGGRGRGRRGVRGGCEKSPRRVVLLGKGRQAARGAFPLGGRRRGRGSGEERQLPAAGSLPHGVAAAATAAAWHGTAQARGWRWVGGFGRRGPKLM